MSGITLEVDIRTVTDTLDTILQHAEDPTALHEAIGADLAELTRQGFHDGQDPYGEDWEHPIFRSGQPLRDTDRLMNSITYRVGSDFVEIGTNVCYASVHQSGAKISAKPGQPGVNSCGQRKGAPYLVFKNGAGQTVRAKEVNIPARPFLPDERGLPEPWRRSLLDTLGEYFGL